ncbi:MAG: hypothetical protein ACTS3F_08050 [Phycisphaerales bacterium]
MNLLIVILAGVMGVLFLWLPISIVQTLMSGWFDLARRFPGVRPSPGSVSATGTTTLLLSRHRWYRVLARYVADDDHLHLRLISPAASFQEGISIPWAAIEEARVNPADTGLARVRIVGYPLEIAVPPKLLEREARVRALMGEGRGAWPPAD